MKIKSIIIIVAISIFILISPKNTVLASNITIVPSVETVKEGQLFTVQINSNDLNIAALTMKIYYDSTKMEYIKENENTNALENSVIYTWVEENGGIENKKTEEIVELKFKAKEEGIASITANGEFFNANGENIEMNYGESKVQIEKIEDEVEVESNNNINSDNAFLEVLRLDKEGIIPNFNKEVTEYYITVDNLVDNLQVTAIPENKEASVEIKGNNNLKNGINKIEIIVTSKDNTQKKVYNINVTRTENIDASNTNLETLAIENTTLYPEFYTDILNYKAEVSNDTKSLNILAIPEKISSQVIIEGNNDLKEGKNTITIKVIAENKITQKNYTIEVYKRNAQEEVEELQEQEEKIEKANELTEEKEQEEIINSEEMNIDKEIEKESENQNQKNNIIILVTTIIILIIIIIYVAVKKKKINYNN